MTGIYSRIIGTGSYLPAKILTNSDLAASVDTSDEWIQQRTGIRQRHIAAEGELASDLALQASRRALEMAGITADRLDLVIVATTTPDMVFPSTACILQSKLGIKGMPAFDVQAVCSGFVYGLAVADNFIRAGEARCALVVGTEVFSRILDWHDRATCVRLRGEPHTAGGQRFEIREGFVDDWCHGQAGSDAGTVTSSRALGGKNPSASRSTASSSGPGRGARACSRRTP